MAATDRSTERGSAWLGSIVAAACALPGVMPSAHAEEAPEQGVIAFKLSSYRESQPGDGTPATASSGSSDASSSRARTYAAMTIASGGSGGSVNTGSGSSSSGSTSISRMKVLSPSLYALVPINRQWAVEGSATYDAVSGASPAYYSDMASASQVDDQRKAVDLKLTRYFDRQALALGVAHSTESDYVSNALSLEGRWASENQNTTWNLGLGLTKDQVDTGSSSTGWERKRTREIQLGVTQALNPKDLVQLQLTRSVATGYLSDPYKYNDSRPDERDAGIVQLRWHHALASGALKWGYRYYRDTFGIRAHTADLAWVMPMSSTSAFTPSLRYHTQNAASFYVDPSSDSSVYPGTSGSPTYFSVDQRLSAFGAFTLGGKIDWEVARRWNADLKLEWYHQASGLRLGGTGSPGLQPLNALMMQIGLSHPF